MKLQVMAAYDNKARVFLNPFYVSQVAVGVRAFAEAANTPGHQICSHPQDFTLFHLGSYNDDNAVFEFITPYGNLGLAAQYKTLGSPDVQSKIA